MRLASGLGPEEGFEQLRESPSPSSSSGEEGIPPIEEEAEPRDPYLFQERK